MFYYEILLDMCPNTSYRYLNAVQNYIFYIIIYTFHAFSFGNCPVEASNFFPVLFICYINHCDNQPSALPENTVCSMSFLHSFQIKRTQNYQAIKALDTKLPDPFPRFPSYWIAIKSSSLKRSMSNFNIKRILGDF